MSVSNEYIRVLKRLFEGAAYQFWHEQHPEELIFRDACNFWNITPASTNEELEVRLTTIENVFSFMRRLLKEEGNLKISNRMSISKRDVDSCSNLNRQLQATFADDLSYIKRRENRHGIKRMSHDIR